MDNMQKRVRVLEAFAVLSLLVLGVLAFTAFAQTRQKFDERTVERLNVVEKNGQLVAVIANTDRMPDPIVGGKTFSRSGLRAGSAFLNLVVSQVNCFPK